uniref:Uncharacterized protein n=1 Tax=Molossus molossus TaxID=27622 RepID=A0A7J8FZQ8_MOLMO|nr:hypothetical protein HJG59_008199 [Molossus molossus]
MQVLYLGAVSDGAECILTCLCKDEFLIVTSRHCSGQRKKGAGSVGMPRRHLCGAEKKAGIELRAASGASLGVSNMAEDIKTRIKNYCTAPFDSCFPNQNQTRNCWQNYLDFHRCEKAMTAKGGDVSVRKWYRRVQIPLPYILGVGMG